MRHKETRPARCAAKLFYCSVRDWTRFCYVIDPDSTVNTLSNSLSRNENIRNFTVEFAGRKPHPERKSCAFKNMRIRVDGARVPPTNGTQFSE